MRTLINKFDKETVYNYYLEIVDNPKGYLNITRNKMVEEIQDYFKTNLEFALDFLMLENYKLLVEIAQSKSSFVKAKNTDIFSTKNFEDILYLEDLKIIKGELHYKLLPEIKEALNKIENHKEIEFKKEFDSVALGFIEVYGYIDIVDINDYVEEIMATNEGYDIFDSFVISRLLIKEYDFSEDGYIFHPYYVNRNIDNIPSPRIIYDKRMYIEFANYGAPLFAIESYKEIYPQMETLNDFDFIPNLIHGEIQNEFNKLMYFYHLLDTEENIKEITMHVNWPVWDWGGMSFLIYNEAYDEQRLIVSEDFVKNVHASIMVAAESLDYGVYKENITPIDLVRVLQDLFSNKNAKENLLEQLPSQDLESLKPFKNAIVIKDGIIWDLHEGICSIYHENIIYHIQGFKNLIEDEIDSSVIPSNVDCVLLPLDGGITFIADFIINEITGDINHEEIDIAEDVHSYQDLLELESIDDYKIPSKLN